MGRLKKRGNIGQMSGAVGDVVVSEWNNIPVVRSLPARSSKALTQAQLEQQVKMSLAVKFIRSIKNVVQVGFRSVAFKMSGYNAAVRHLLTNAITGEYPDFKIDYSQVSVTRGEGKGAVGASASSTVAETITFKWSNRSKAGKVRPDDKAILVVYCEALNVSEYTVEGPARSTGEATIEMPDFSGQEVHTWLAFVSADGEIVFDSSYTGNVKIA